MAEKVVRVSQNSSADFKTVQEAIDWVPLKNKSRVVIRVMPGVYKQPVYVPKTKDFITLVGSYPEKTILTWHNTFEKVDHPLESSGVIGKGTFGCGSVIVEGSDFIAENITFENAAPEGSHQAVAVRVTADRCAFYNCRFLGWQDTLYLHYGKQYLKNCYIEGSVDFIFGNSTALFEHCQLHCKADGFITAQQRRSSDEPTGYIFLRCVVTGNGNKAYAYLGRPWAPFGRVLFAHTYLDQCIKPEGWHNWENQENEASACFYEHGCFGPGSESRGRVSWCKGLNEKEAEQFLVHSFIDPDTNNSWLAQKLGTKTPHSASETTGHTSM